MAQRDVVPQAVAERLASAESSHQDFRQPSGQGIGFYTGDDGYMYCDNQRVDDIRAEVMLLPQFTSSPLPMV